MSSVSFCHKHKNKRRRPVQIADAESSPLRNPHASRVIHNRRGKCGQKSEAAEMKHDPRRSSGLEALPPHLDTRGIAIPNRFPPSFRTPRAHT